VTLSTTMQALQATMSPCRSGHLTDRSSTTTIVRRATLSAGRTTAQATRPRRGDDVSDGGG
jgi:hypothetical protein